MKSDRDFLKSQLLQTKEMKELVAEHPLMAYALAQREEDLQKELEDMPIGQQQPKALLLFSGDPVAGSAGIDVGFAGRALLPFQNMVKADYADRWHGILAARGRRSGEEDSQMLLTALPRGSFGMLLEQAKNGDFYASDNLAGTLAHVARLVDSAAKSDEEFALRLNETAPRVLQNLQTFLTVVAKGKAGLDFETGDFRVSLNPIEANEAYNRVSNANTSSKRLIIPGSFKGALLESWRFDFLTQDGHLITGHLHDNLSTEEVEGFDREFVNKYCFAFLEETTVQFKNGRCKTTYVLVNLGNSELVTVPNLESPSEDQNG